MQLKHLACHATVTAIILSLAGCNLFKSATETAPKNDMNIDVDMPQQADGGVDLGDADMGVEVPDVGLNIPDLPREEFESEEAVVADRRRATADLIALWLFDEGEGDTVFDVSGVEPALDLTLSGNTNWAASLGALSFRDGEAVAMTPTKLYDRWLASERMSVEFWARSTDDTQNGPTRLITLSEDSSSRNLTMGIERDEMHIRIRGNRTNENNSENNGEPFLDPAGIVDLDVHHWVMTYDGWKVRLYRDAELVFSTARPQTFENWNRSYALSIGNEFESDRNLRAEVFLIALYDRPLRPEEIQRNYDAGFMISPEDASVPEALR